MDGQKRMMTREPYRLYLRWAGQIICRHDFGAENDLEAGRLAALLADALSDVSSVFELWQGARVIACPTADGLLNGGGGGPAAVPEGVVAAAEAILQSGWPAARSKRLLSHIDSWRKRPDPSVLEKLIRDAVSATGADTGNIQLHDGAGALRIAAQHGLEREFLDFFAVVRSEDGSCGHALKEAKRIIVEDIGKSGIFRRRPSGAVLARAGLRSTYSTPVVGDGRILGMISTHRRIKWRPDASELRQMDHFSAAVASAIGG